MAVPSLPSFFFSVMGKMFISSIFLLLPYRYHLLKTPFMSATFPPPREREKRGGQLLTFVPWAKKWACKSIPELIMHCTTWDLVIVLKVVSNAAAPWNSRH